MAESPSHLTLKPRRSEPPRLAKSLSVALVARDHPSSPGGTPTYTNALAAHLKKLGARVPKVPICSRLEPRKNVSEALGALSETRGVPFELEVIGDGPERGRLESLSRELGLRASFRGAVWREALYASFAESDIFFSPSRSEGSGLSALEAMTPGCAVVLSDITAYREFVTRMRNGILYSDYPQLVSSLDQLLKEQSFGRGFGENARQAATSYSWDELLGPLSNSTSGC